QAGESESKIGRNYGTTQATIRKAIEWWHTSRKLPVPKFADRRTAQVELANTMYGAGCKLSEIKAELGLSVASIGKMLDGAFASKGEARPDGRSRRRQSA